MPTEINLPFGVDATGAIGATTDLGKQTQNHVLSAAGTNKGERVMAPDFGARLVDHVFAGITDSEVTSLQADINAAIEAWAPDANVTEIEVSDDPADGIVNVLVRFTATNSDTEQTVTIPTSLPTA